ncbi:MAG TPA: hypothetical protein VHZ26_05825 [Caulobacteraceae bacterium]|jgi:hypothetical protein|nr:hypothetical protein [Caulobacteraceae bacterium]
MVARPGPPGNGQEDKRALNRRHAITGLVLACAGLAESADSQPLLRPPFFGLLRPKPAPPLVFAYHGWKVDASRSAHGQAPDKTVRLVEAQLDLVEHVGLKPEVLTLMRGVPIIVVADNRETVGYGKSGVVLNARRLDTKKPAALFGLLQAYLDRGLPGGLANPDIDRYRREAAGAHVWPKTALMLQSDGDFFGMTAGAYLVGVTTHEPYTRAHLQKTQPGYYQWLAKLFDNGVARR